MQVNHIKQKMNCSSRMTLFLDKPSTQWHQKPCHSLNKQNKQTQTNVWTKA